MRWPIFNDREVTLWLLDRFDMPEHDRYSSIGMMRDGQVVGGVLYERFNGVSITGHLCLLASDVATPDFFWMAMHYPLMQLGVRKFIAPVSGNNLRVASILHKLGFRPEATLRGIDRDGDTVFFIATLDRWPVRWRNYRSKVFVSNKEAV